jgi:hypothetical protein
MSQFRMQSKTIAPPVAVPSTWTFEPPCPFMFLYLAYYEAACLLPNLLIMPMQGNMFACALGLSGASKFQSRSCASLMNFLASLARLTQRAQQPVGRCVIAYPLFPPDSLR